MARSNPFPPTSAERSIDDSARFVVPLSKFQRPRFYILGGGEFEFPIGTEGMRLTGSATLAEHKYVSDNAPYIQVTHRDAATVTMEGELPGKTGSENMRLLRNMCMAADPPDGKRLELPGIFTQAQKVVSDNYEFSRAENDPWGFTYMIVFRIIGVMATKHQTSASPAVPSGPKGNPKGTSVHTYTVIRNTETLRSVAFLVYGDADLWRNIYDLNKTVFSKLFPNAQISQMPTKLLPIGTKLQYRES